MTITHTNKPPWLFGVLFSSLVTDGANIVRLLHGAVPAPFYVPWFVAGLSAIFLAWGKVSSIRGVRIFFWIILSLAVLLLSLLSDGTNLSLWVWLGIISGPVPPVLSKRLTAGFFGLAHVITQAFLLPLPVQGAPLSYGVIALTGALVFITWHQWRRVPLKVGSPL
ncbi:hypothetical protein Sulac_0792 [Sulfobacillus acidophilus DSM 10332]|uniref:Uncharacterized protein n=1 Tax=Sulfobacillus acidophilus (strain ATCC 700253 / DSM 10332 / NAL) TaxID=679936 RepID=G8U162_SULAD|nr:hypothetical protein Sulac_0792 [Sulfobacillus acidophilus DSM 10332]